MSTNKLRFVKIDILDLLVETEEVMYQGDIAIATYFRNLRMSLATNNPALSSYGAKLLAEAETYSSIKRNNGRKGGEALWRKKENSDNALANDSTAIAKNGRAMAKPSKALANTSNDCTVLSCSVNSNSLTTENNSSSREKPNRKKRVQAELPPDLSQIWDSAPQIARQRSSKSDFAQAWAQIPNPPPPEMVIQAIEAYKSSRDWIREDGQYIPALHRWIKKLPWETMPSKPKDRFDRAKETLAEATRLLELKQKGLEL